jgi:hypothetical protein
VEQTLKAISENVYVRGKHGNLYVRRRIPAAIRAAYPARQEHITRSLGVSDVRVLIHFQSWAISGRIHVEI